MSKPTILVILGIYALFRPGLTLLSWAFVIGCFLLADGILAIIAGVSGWGESRGWTFLRGVLAILAGAFAVGHPAIFGAFAALTVICVIASWSIIGGVLEIMVAIKKRKAIEGEWWMILDGGLSILFGIVLLMAPLLSASLLIRVSGVLAIFFGIGSIFVSFRLRKLKSNTSPSAT